jgi:hypothetical protein
MDAQASIEVNQGVDHKGRTFGYDHDRKNFITWDIADGKIVVALVENDEQEEAHGSIAETTRDAKSVADSENRKENSQLRRAILDRFHRD